MKATGPPCEAGVPSEQSSLAQRDNTPSRSRPGLSPRPPTPCQPPKQPTSRFRPLTFSPCESMAPQRLSRGPLGRAPAAAPRGVKGQRAAAEAQTQRALRDPAGEAGRSGAEPPLAVGRRGRALAAGIAGRRRGRQGRRAAGGEGGATGWWGRQRRPNQRP